MRVMRHDCVAIQEVSLIIVRDGAVCLVRRANTGYEDGKYCLPAGHKEPGETPTVGVAREAMEEIGVRVDPADVRLVHTMHRMCHGRADGPDHERAAYFFEASRWEGEPSNVEPAKSDDVAWFPLDALPDMVPYMRDALEHVRAGRVYSESEH